MTLNRISVLAAPIAIFVLFGSTLIGKDALAFRDVSHFYTPLYDYVAHRTSEAWIPLWNPLDATGISLLGETTTAVLYPPRYLIFSLPVSTDVAMSIYVVVHLVLASLFASFAARWAGSSRVASQIAGVMYPLSGSVIFLYTNPPFLVGACWLPVVIASLTTTRKVSIVNRCLIAGPALAMMVTGGDPQTALHALLVVSAFWIARRIWKAELQAPLVAIIASALLAGILAAPQLAASVAWSQQSERVDRARFLGDRNEHWLAPPAAGSRRSESYQFSMPPWHVAEFLTPCPFGTLLPVNSRLSSLIPGDGRMWTPTVYLGSLAALMLVMSLMGFRHRQSHRNPWLWVAAISLFLSFGHFGIVWMFQQIPGVLTQTDSAVGGPYWLLYHYLPSYDAFRYPAKWLPVCSLAMSIAVSIWIDQLHTVAQSAVRSTLVTYLAMISAATATLIVWRYIADGHSLGIADHYWGPLNVSQATSRIVISIGHSIVALLAVLVVLRTRWKMAKQIHLLLLIVTLDLGAAAYTNVAKIDRSQTQAFLDVLDQSRVMDSRHRWMRTQSGGGWPRLWRQTNNPQRIVEVSASERSAWFGRWHLQDRQAVFNNMVSIRSRAMSDFWAASDRVTESMTAEQRDRFWHHVRLWLQIDGVLHASDQTYTHHSSGREYNLVDVTIRDEMVAETPFRFSTNWSLCDSNVSFDDFLRDVHQQRGAATVLIDTQDSFAIDQTEATGSKAMIEIANDTSETTTLRVRNRRAGILVRSVFQDGSWQAEIRPRGSDAWKSTRVYPVNFITQGIALDAGDWEIRFRYAPPWLSAALAVSAVGWLICTLIAVNLLRRRFLKIK